MTPDTIFLTIVAAAPAIAAIFSIIAAVVKLIKANKNELKVVVNELVELRNEVVKTEQYDELKAQMAEVYRENAVLKKKLNELLCEIKRIKSGDDEV